MPKKRAMAALAIITAILAIGMGMWYNSYGMDGEYEYMTVWIKDAENMYSEKNDIDPEVIQQVIENSAHTKEGVVMTLEEYNQSGNFSDVQLVFYKESEFDFNQYSSEKYLRNGANYSGLTWYMQWDPLEEGDSVDMRYFNTRYWKVYQVTYVKNKKSNKWYPCYGAQSLEYDVSVILTNYSTPRLDTNSQRMNGIYTQSRHYQMDGVITAEHTYQGYNLLETSEWAKEQAKASYEKYRGRKVVWDEPIKTTTLYSPEDEVLVTVKWKNVKLPVIKSE